MEKEKETLAIGIGGIKHGSIAFTAEFDSDLPENLKTCISHKLTKCAKEVNDLMGKKSELERLYGK